MYFYKYQTLENMQLHCSLMIITILTSVSLLEISDSKADIKITHIGQLFELSLFLFVKDTSVCGHSLSSGQI